MTTWPTPDQVLSGVVFGAANELVGTLQPIFAATAQVRTSQMRTTAVSRDKRRGASVTLPTQCLVRSSKKSVSIVSQTPRITVFSVPDAVTVRTNYESVL